MISTSAQQVLDRVRTVVTILTLQFAIYNFDVTWKQVFLDVRIKESVAESIYVVL